MANGYLMPADYKSSRAGDVHIIVDNVNTFELPSIGCLSEIQRGDTPRPEGAGGW